jgi:hypothetical protein
MVMPWHGAGYYSNNTSNNQVSDQPCRCEFNGLCHLQLGSVYVKQLWLDVATLVPAVPAAVKALLVVS